MKTVMKKMFSLLLVAVLLVSVMPFAAFAESEEPTKCADCNQIHADGVTVCCTICKQTGHDEGDEHCSVCGWRSGHSGTCTYGCDESATCAWDKAHKTTCLSKAVCEHCGAVAEHFTNNCPKFCTKCSQDNHDESENHCSVCGWYSGHKEGCTNWKCATCGQTKHEDSVKCCATCKEIGHATTDPHCTHCGRGNGTHPDSCPNSANYYSNCDKCADRYVTANGHPECEICNNVNTADDATCHATANCPYCKICWDNGDEVKLHKTADHCEICGKTDGTHKQGYSCYKSTGNSTVKVHVRLYTSNVHTKTVELLTYKDSSDARIYSSVAKHDDLIRAELAKQYPGYSWSGNLYDNPSELEDTKETIGKGTTVYINAYTDQDLVYIYVHNSRSMSNLRIIQLEGKQVGETVTKSEVTKAVSKYFSVNNLSMYSEQAWEDYVDGESVESVSSLKVTSDPYFIDVKISGSAKSTSGSGSTADSTNPKTGDAIFAPAMILGLSASALVVLYYLNKKRAF